MLVISLRFISFPSEKEYLITFVALFGKKKKPMIDPYSKRV